MAKWNINLHETFRLASTLASIALLFVVGRLLWVTFSDVPTTGDKAQIEAERRDAQREPLNLKNAVLQIAVDPDCRFCEESFPFYRALLAARNGSATFRTEALVSIPVQTGIDYLNRHNLPVDSVRQVNYAAEGIEGTPLIRIQSELGTMVHKWSGLLSTARENEVVFLLGVQKQFLSSSRAESRRIGSDPHDPDRIDPANAARAINSGIAIVVDTSSRSQYSRLHLKGSKNIPLDELATRAPNELDVQSQILVFCRESTACSKDVLVQMTCVTALSQLRLLGFRNTRLISGSLDNMRSLNVDVESSERVYLPRLLLTESR